jgi:hypothetical protein
MDNGGGNRGFAGASLSGNHWYNSDIYAPYVFLSEPVISVEQIIITAFV